MIEIEALLVVQALLLLVIAYYLGGCKVRLTRIAAAAPPLPEIASQPHHGAGPPDCDRPRRHRIHGGAALVI